MRAALYVRVSTQEQKVNGLSIDNQIDALTAFCAANGHTVVDVYNDAGISGRRPWRKRPELCRMVNDCQSGLVDIVVMTRLDRFFRSVKDYYAVIEQMNGVPWRAIWEDYETETSSGCFKVNIMLSIAQAEAERTSEKIKSVNEYKRARGEFHGGKAPTGYICRDGSLHIDESQRAGVQAYFDTYALTLSMSRARVAALEHGLNIKKATARRMLDNPTYYGNAYGHETEAYITREQFNRNQEELARYTKATKENTLPAIYSGLLTCGECGCHLVVRGGFDVLRSGRRIPKRGYQCSRHRNDVNACPGVDISQKKFEATMLDIIAGDMERANYAVEIEEKRRGAEAEIKRLRDKLARIGIRFEDGDISIETYRLKRNEILAQIDDLEQTPAGTSAALPDGWREQYAELDGDGKRAFWHGIIKEVVVCRDNPYSPKIIYR